MTSAAARQRLYRQRRKGGRVVLRVEIDEVATPEALIDAGFLSPFDADDVEALTRAVEQALASLAAVLIERDA